MQLLQRRNASLAKENPASGVCLCVCVRVSACVCVRLPVFDDEGFDAIDFSLLVSLLLGTQNLLGV